MVWYGSPGWVLNRQDRLWNDCKVSSQMAMSFDVLVGDCRVDVVDRKVVAVWGGRAVFKWCGVAAVVGC